MKNNIVLPDPFQDERGKIQNILVDVEIKSVAVIESKKGAIRSNHWHKQNTHRLYILSGKVEYSERNLDGSEKTCDIYEAGTMIYTGPNKVHKLVSLTDSIMISLAPQSNHPDCHDQDTVKEIF